MRTSKLEVSGGEDSGVFKYFPVVRISLKSFEPLVIPYKAVIIG